MIILAIFSALGYLGVGIKVTFWPEDIVLLDRVVLVSACFLAAAVVFDFMA